MPSGSAPTQPRIAIDGTSETDSVLGELPPALRAMTIATAAAAVLALLIPISVLLTAPALAMLGLWPASIAWRLKKTLPGARNMLDFTVFSEMGQYAIFVSSLGLSGVLLVLIGFGVIMQPDLGQDEGNLFVRTCMTLYAMVVIPASLILRGRAERHLGTRA